MRSMTLEDYRRPTLIGQTPLHDAAHGSHINEVIATLQTSGEKLTLDDFLIKDGFGETPLHLAAYHGCIDQVMAALQISGEKLSSNHLLIKDNGGYTPLDWAMWQGYLPQIFVPSHWANRVGEMMELWEQVPPEYQERAKEKGFDFQKIAHETILVSLPPGRRIDLGNFDDATRTSVSYSQAGELAERDLSQ